MPSALTNNSSPFLLRPDDVTTLAESDGFKILSQHLSQHYIFDVCEDHSTTNIPDIEPWVTVRDVIHALLVPVVELFEKATAVSSHATHATKLEDLEYAFTGQARSAFVWLQCFLSSESERSWCYTLGCPACVVRHCLDSEFCIRILYAACLLSDVHYPFTLEGPSLPSFMFFLDSLEQALDKDPLYGPGFLEITKPKAEATREGVEDLIHQCLELETELGELASSESGSPISSRDTSPNLGPTGSQPGMKVKRSKIARQQIRMQREEERWIEEIINRRCKELRLGETQQHDLNLEAKPKQGATVEVREVGPDT